MKPTRLRRALALLAGLSLVAAACGNGSSSSDGASSPTAAAPDTTAAPATDAMEEGLFGLPVIDPFDVAGDIAIAGSSTVFPLAEALVALFEDEGYDGNITIDSIGSGAGFERFCVAGESDISNASRPINDEEVAQCQAIGRQPIEIRIGTDALAVTVSPSNTFATDLTVEELAVLFSTADTWQDVRADFPANPIQRFIPGTDSGTFDYFVEEVFDEDEEPILSADNTQLSEDDNVLVQGISGDTCDPDDPSTSCAVGFFGYAYYSENSDRLKVLNIEGVEPTTETVNADEYPLARPLFMYTAPLVIGEKPQVGEFLAFALQNVNRVIGDVGYFPAPDDVLQGAADALTAAMAG